MKRNNPYDDNLFIIVRIIVYPYYFVLSYMLCFLIKAT